MLDFKVFCARMQHDKDRNTGSYTQYFVDGTDLFDAKQRVKLEFGPGWNVLEIDGPIEHLEAKQ